MISNSDPDFFLFTGTILHYIKGCVGRASWLQTGFIDIWNTHKIKSFGRIHYCVSNMDELSLNSLSHNPRRIYWFRFDQKKNRTVFSSICSVFSIMYVICNGNDVTIIIIIIINDIMNPLFWKHLNITFKWDTTPWVFNSETKLFVIFYAFLNRMNFSIFVAKIRKIYLFIFLIMMTKSFRQNEWMRVCVWNLFWNCI